uniref:TBC1 domain family member 13-like n=1 Tax=Erigeron canadensis TaxID=72917 RepID=UPI001CB99F80|nr:TBC1 domain family member 13-like [Erigeron canadensis]
MVTKKKKSVPDWLNSPILSSSTTIKSPPRLNTTSSYEDPIAGEYSLKSSPASSVTSSDSCFNESISKKEEVRVSSSIRSGSSDNDAVTSSSANFNSVTIEDISRHSHLLQELSRKIINIGELRQLASLGIPDAAGIRSTVWKLLLGYLPVDKGLWSSELAKKRSRYKHFKEELLINPSDITRKLEDSAYSKNCDHISEARCLLARSKIPHGEHPLSLGKTSIWNQFFQDSEITKQIDRDVKRTHPDIQFFSGDSAFAKANQDSLKNILIIFAKLNPGIKYVQGMNEILAPLFYVFKNDPNEDYVVNAEADTFFCFVELISDFRENFCQQLDNSIVGIRSTITSLSQLLKQHDEELWRHLEVTTKVNPQFYAFRWITLLLTQEFNFADSLHVWDSLLSNPEGPQEALLRVCCAMLILVRRRLLAGDFTANLKLLQSYPPTNVSHLLYVAHKLHSHSTQLSV